MSSATAWWSSDSSPLRPMLGIDFATIMAGLFITENLFGLPGLGQLAVRSVATDDFPW
jgi:peptide/nickel transport system permease protein